MLSLTDRDAVSAALNDRSLDLDVRALIALRAWQLDVERNRPLGDTVQFFVIQPGDTLDVIEAALGFPLLTNHDTGELFDEDGFEPSFEWLEDHGTWFEIAYVLTDDFGVLVFVQDDPGVEFDVHSLCLAHSGRPFC